MSLAGRTALVTGGGTGLGAALARALAAEGATVWVAGRTAARLEAVAATDARLHPLPLDVTDETAVARAFDQIGTPEIVVANAGAAESAPLAATTLETWQAMLAVNLTGVFLTLREAARRLGKAEYGRLIVVASTAGLKGYAYASAYTAAKHGAVGLVRAAALELARTGVTVNALCPGFLDTEMTDRSIANISDKTGKTPEDARAALEAMSPQHRLIAPEEVARAALWLCTAEARGVTGQAIPIAGGEV